jgi:hypothetical protein
MNALSEIHPAILSWLRKNWEIEIGNHCTNLDCYTKMKNINIGTWYHAHPNYCNGGPWQDWAMVSFGTNSAKDGSLSCGIASSFFTHNIH